jgi:hypothetical protein
MNHGAQICGKAGRGKAGKGFVHNRNRTNLFLGEFVGPLEVVDFDLAGICRRTKILRLRVSGIDSGEQLINFILGQNFSNNNPPS